MNLRATVVPRLGAVAAVVFWGISFVATKRALEEISPIALIFGRAALGSLVLLAILRARRLPSRLAPPRETWLPLVAMGFVGIAFHQMLQAYALRFTSAVNTGWLIGLTPIWSAILASWMLRERPGAVKVGGLTLGFLGALLIVSRGRLDAAMLALPAARGDFLILASTVNWAFYTVLSRGVVKRIGPVQATAGALVSGTLLLAPFWVLERGWSDYTSLSSGGWIALLFLGIACSGFGYLFWYAALDRLEATGVASFLYLEPLVTLGAAIVLLGEEARAIPRVGGALLLLGVFLVQGAGRGEGAPDAPRNGAPTSPGTTRKSRRRAYKKW